MVAAGYTSIGGVEWHAPAADIYDANHDAKLTRANILDIRSIPSVDLLWMSPPCPAFSIANTKRGETDADTALATHIVKLAVDSRPRSIAIENVRGYQSSRSLAIIIEALGSAGYKIDSAIYNAANYGTPTTRQRLIVRATLGELEQVAKTHQKPSNQLSLFGLPGWISWWGVVCDRVEELPRSQLTENQKLSVVAVDSKILVDGIGNNHGSSYTTLVDCEPANTITASTAKHPHRIMIERVGYYNGTPNQYQDCPAPTIRSAPHCDDKGAYRVAYNILDNYDCYAADIKCLAAWQGFPPDYNWLDNRAQAGRGIGNSVPPPLARAIASSLNN